MDFAKLKKSLEKNKTMGFVVLGVLAVVIVAALYLVSQKPSKEYRFPEIFQVVPLDKTAVLTLTTGASQPVPVGNNFSVDIYLDTGLGSPDGNPPDGADGVDLIINFNRSLVQLNDISPQQGCSYNSSDYAMNCFKTFAPQVLSSGQPTGQFDVNQVISDANSSGRIEFGAVAFDFSANDKTPPVNNGNQRIATLTFNATADGTASLNWDVSGNPPTVDTNVAAHNSAGDVDDILTRADGLSVNIGSATGCQYYDIIPDGVIDYRDFLEVIRNWSSFTPQDRLDRLLYIIRSWNSTC
jgi:hypothetical protein